MNLPFFIQSGCSKAKESKKLVIFENKCKIIFENESNQILYEVRIDNCLIKDGKRCDYLVLIPRINSAIFIELKGKNLLYAIKQINSSIDLLIKYLDKSSIHARIILTKVNTPNLMNNPIIYKFEKRINRLNGTLKIGSIEITERVV